MEGISRRELARRQGISESAVRRHIDSGALVGAVLGDGSLHPEKAVEALSGVVTHAKLVPVALTNARTRRLRVQVRKLMDEVADLRASTIAPEDATEMLSEQIGIVATALRTIPDAAAALAGRSAAEALPLLRGIIHEALQANADTEEDDDWWNDPIERRVDLDALAPNALLARRIDLAAQKLEIEHGLMRGKLRKVEQVDADWGGRLGVCKSLVFAIPGRVGQQVEGASPNSLRALVAAEVEGALGEL